MSKEAIYMSLGRLYEERLQSLNTLDDINTTLTWAGFLLSPVAGIAANKPEFLVSMAASFIVGMTNNTKLGRIRANLSKEFKKVSVGFKNES